MLTQTAMLARSSRPGSNETRCGLDPDKMRAYELFLAENCKDKVVCDIGTGPGILAFLALKLGAKKVYCLDYNKHSIEVARKNLEEFGDRVEFVICDANEWNFPSDIDIIIHEILGSFIFDENVLKILRTIYDQGMIDKVYPNYYEICTFTKETRDYSKRYKYSPEHFHKYTREFHKLYEQNYPGVIDAHCDLRTCNNTSMRNEWVIWNWSMLDPVETWGQIPKIVNDSIRIGDVDVGWRAYLGPLHAYSNLPKKGNNWIPMVKDEPSTAITDRLYDVLFNRYLNQTTEVPNITNPYEEKTCQFKPM